MQFSASLIAMMAPLVLSAPVLLPRGTSQAFIHNNCGFDITVNPVSAGDDQGFTTIPQGTSWQQTQQNFGGSGQGVSLKINTVDGSPQDIAQFEYTVNPLMNLVFYDLSLIDGNPFGAWPQLLSSNGAGDNIACASNESPCAQAYTWAEQVATEAAPMGSDLHYHVCGTSQ